MTGQSIDVSAYDTAEHNAKSAVCNAQILAFQPVTFQHVGYPTRVSEESELVNYIDILNLNPHMDCVFNKAEFTRGASLYSSYSPDEAEMVCSLFDDVARLTTELFGHPVKPVINGLNQIGIFRAVAEFGRLTGNGKLRILEVGPGFGYLGAYLARLGHTYYSMDVTQGLYLWQNRLMNHLFPGEFRELALERDFINFPDDRVVHIPWWYYCTMFERTVPEVDVIIANGVLGEMSPGALTYSLKIWQLMMQRSSRPILIFNNFGNPIQTSVAGITQQFDDLGYTEVLKERVHGFSPQPELLPRTVKSIMENNHCLYRPSGRTGEFSAEEFVKARRDEMPNALAFNEFITGWTMPDLS